MTTLTETPTAERRNNLPAIPDKLHLLLKPAQKVTINHLAKFGWKLAFVRRPLFLPAIVVIHHAEKATCVVVEETGKVNFKHGLTTRAT